MKNSQQTNFSHKTSKTANVPHPTSRLKVAVVGYGVMGRYHANIYASLPYVDLVAVVDPDPSQQDTARFKHAVRSYEDLDSMLACENLDAVSIAAPTRLHFDICQKCLQAGIHVMVEKPVTTNVTEARALIDLSRQQGLVFQVGHITRFYRAVQLLGEKVSQPYLIEARRLSPNARIQDVGVILDLMIHDIDIVLGLVASPIADVSVSSQRHPNSKYEDMAAAQITFENGCIARFLASRIAPDAERTLVIAESEKTLRIDFSKAPYTEIAMYQPVALRKADPSNSEVHMERTTVYDDNPLKEELEHFLDRILYNIMPIGTLEDDLRALDVATQFITHTEKKTTPSLIF